MTEDAGTVLLVDDEENITTLFAAWLEDSHDVRTANDGAEALELMDEDVDVVLLDRRMPGASGDEILEEIRDQGYHARVAMVTAIDPDFDVLEMGFDDYLTKPVSREELEDVVETLLSRRQYDEEVQRYYSLAAKKAALEAAKPASELANSEEYDALLEELDEVESDLSDQLTADDDFEAAFQNL